MLGFFVALNIVSTIVLGAQTIRVSRLVYEGRARRRQREAAMLEANRNAIQREIDKPWPPHVRADAFTFVNPFPLPLSALERARLARQVPADGPKGTAGDPGAARR